jgi:hypothetical protein
MDVMVFFPLSFYYQTNAPAGMSFPALRLVSQSLEALPFALLGGSFSYLFLFCWD